MVTSSNVGFYAKLDETLESFGFAAKVRELCAPAYDKSGVGRPGIDPAVYLKMLMVGFFEDLRSERAIAARCANSLAWAHPNRPPRWAGAPAARFYTRYSWDC